MTLAAPLCPPRGVIDPVGVARREAALIEALRARPGAALGEIAEAAGPNARRPLIGCDGWRREAQL
jgi:hypothetical protein